MIDQRLLLVWRNFGSLAGAEVISRAVMLAAVGFYARQLQPEMFGYLGFAMAVVSYPAVLIALGMDFAASQEIARAPREAGRYAGQVLALRLVIASFAYAVLATGVWKAALPDLLKQLLWIEALTLFPLALTSSWAFQGLQQMHTVALVRVGQTILSTGLVLWLVRGPQAVALVSLSNVLSGAVAAFLLLVFLRRVVGPFRLGLDLRFVCGLLRRSLPFALMLASVQVYCQSGSVLLGWWQPASEVGLFNSAYRLTFGLVQQFSALLLTAFLPAMSRAYAYAPGELIRFHRGYERIAWLCAGGVLAVFALFPGPVLALCFGASYRPAAPLLRLLACAMAGSFLGAPSVAMLLATRLELRVTALTVLAAGVSLLLNVWLIPQRGSEGAAVALFTGTMTLTAGTIYSCYRRSTELRPAAC